MAFPLGLYFVPKEWQPYAAMFVGGVIVGRFVFVWLGWGCRGRGEGGTGEEDRGGRGRRSCAAASGLWGVICLEQ